MAGELLWQRCVETAVTCCCGRLSPESMASPRTTLTSTSSIEAAPICEPVAWHSLALSCGTMTQPVADDDDDAQRPHSYSTVPRNNKIYSQQKYWEERFEHESEYEWLVGFNDIRSTLLPLLRSTDRILVIGCGNSNLSAQLYEAGHHHITSIDYVDTVVRKQAARHRDKPDMRWLTMDMLHMTFPPASFTVVLDKCTMDALTTAEGSPWQPNEATRAAVHTLLSSTSTLLTDDGRYIQISFTQPHFRHRYLKRRAYQWAVRTTRVGDGLAAVFVYECVKGGTEAEWEDEVWSDKEEESASQDRGREDDEDRRELSSDEEDVLNAIEVSDDDEEAKNGVSGETIALAQSSDERSAVR